jgi:hypothetical protein
VHHRVSIEDGIPPPGVVSEQKRQQRSALYVISDLGPSDIKDRRSDIDRERQSFDPETWCGQRRKALEERLEY